MEDGSPIIGNPNAEISIVEFGDYQCTFCYKFHQNTLNSIQSEYIDSGKINYVYRDFPLNGSDSILAAEATYCANDQGRYWDYHIMLYNYQEGVDSGWANNDRLKSFAFNLGLELDKFSHCLDSKKYLKQIKFNHDKAKSMGATSTPSFLFVNTSGEQQRVVGAQPYSTFQQVIDSLL